MYICTCTCTRHAQVYPIHMHIHTYMHRQDWKLWWVSEGRSSYNFASWTEIAAHLMENHLFLGKNSLQVLLMSTLKFVTYFHKMSYSLWEKQIMVLVGNNKFSLSHEKHLNFRNFSQPQWVWLSFPVLQMFEIMLAVIYTSVCFI